MNNTVNRASLGTMKNLLNFKRLWTDSHEKRSPQRFFRYAAMLIMLLTLGVGQAWAADDTLENSSHIYFCDKDCGNFRTNNAVPRLNLHIKNTDNWELICGTSLGNDYWDFVIPSSGDYDQVQIGRYSACNGDDWNCWSNRLNVSDRPSNSHNYLHMTESDWTQTLTWRTWTIAGNNTDLLGSSWAFNASSNDMEFDPATQTFSLTKTFTSSSSNLSIEYKAGMDHGATTTIGNNGSNKSFTITYPGTYAITFTLNAAQNAVTEVVKRQFCDTELSSTGGSSSTINLSCYIVDSKYRIVIKGTGLTGISSGVYFMYGGTGEGHQLKTYATTVSNTSTNITYDIPWNALPPLFYTKLFVLYPGESQFAQIENQEIDWEHSCVVTYYSVTYDGSDATDGSAPTDDNSYESGENVTVAAKPDGLIKTNYIFSGWNTAPDMTGTTYVAAATFSISSNTTLYAKWAQGIVLDANRDHHGTGENKNVTAIWNKAALEDGFSATTGETGYTLDGYYTTAVGGTKVLNADGSFAYTNVSDYITSGRWSHTGSAPTLYAHWVADTWTLETSSTTLGTFINTDDDEYCLNINVDNTFVSTDVRFVLNNNHTTWYFQDGNDPTTNNAAINLISGTSYQHWIWAARGHYTLKVWKDGSWKYCALAMPQINYTASPTGGSVEASSNHDGAINAGDYVMYGSDITFEATPSSGYTFEGWYAASDYSGGILSTTNPLTESVVTSATGRYAKFTEDLVTLAANDGDHGTVAITAGTSAIGISTSATITATPATNYHVASWETSSNVVTVSGGGATSSITVRTDGTGDAATVTPIYAEDDSSFKLMKRGSSDGDDVVWATFGAATNTVTITDLPAETTYKIYVHDNTPSTGKNYRNSGGVITVNQKSDKIYQYAEDKTGHYFTFTTSIAGDYTFAFTWSSDPGTLSATYPVEPSYSATVRLKDGTTPRCSVSRTGAISLHEYEYTTITATPEPGFRFKQWNTSGCSFANSTTSTDATASFTATANGATIEAEFTQDGFIYFDNTMSKWDDSNGIYVYLFDNNCYYNTKVESDGHTYWGVVPKKDGHLKECGRMTRIPGTQIYYYRYSYASSFSYVAFSQRDQSNYDSFSGTSAAYRGDFNTCLPCYIASEGATEWKNGIGYQNSGYWKRYGNTNSGFWLYYTPPGNSEQSIEFTVSDPYSYLYTAELEFSSANSNYSYNVARCNEGKKLRRAEYNGEFQDSDSDYPRELSDAENADGKLRTSAAGTYKFTLSLTTDHIMMTVEYPLSVGDYRVRLNNGIKSHPSGRVIRARSEEQTDTVSFFIDHTKTNTLYVDSCTSTGNPPTWNRISDVAAATITLSDEPYTTKTGVYNFAITRTKNKNVSLSLLETPEYDGDYYIRTDAADGKWTSYLSTDDNKMHYSPTSLSKSGYNYYFTKWALQNTNMHYTIANDYSPCISDTLKSDATYLNGSDALPDSANVRFTWNSKTNGLSRAFINGSSMNNRFLVLTGDSKTFTEAGGLISADAEKGLAANELEFEDKGNWVYQLDIKAKSGSTVDVTANYNSNEQTFIDNQTLITSSDGDKKYHLRAVYDFKTDILTTAWVPDGVVSGDLTVTADMMLIRHAQDAAQQLTFANNNSSVSSIKKMIGAIEFRKDSIVGRVSHFRGDTIGTGRNRANRELMLYISFPFDVAVNDIYGCGQLNKEWYLQYYDGADRARKGFFRGDGTTTFWKFMTLSDTLRAGQGYSLLLDNDYFNSDAEDGDNVWHNIAAGGSVYLYFPSANNLHGDSIIAKGPKSLTVPSHECLHDRTFESGGKTLNHKFTDSHWNMIGVPLFQNQTGMETTKFTTTNPSDDQLLTPLVADHGYFYEWDSLRNDFSVHTTSGYLFKSMHGYMVQFTGTIGFTGASIQPKPSSIVARRSPMSDEDYTLEMQLLKNNQRVSRAYVELRDEACDTFALNEDVYMVYTSLPADLYTYAGNYDVSANVLPIDNHVVPVGIEVHQAGVYTFTMPDNFSGGVTLVDNVLNTRTNLALSDYEVTLPKGICDGRFYLELDIQKSPTSIDVIEEGGSLKDGKAHKFIQNGVMYILQDGKIYDARGNRVK